jgi:MoaA/NifB/PqqE/SkfB family radical SAM enzyme
MLGRSADEYRAPLFVAWQLTNRCQGRCIACCEDSGPHNGWRDELTRAEALGLARDIAAFGVPFVAFGGGEPLGVPFCFELFERLSAGGVALKIETDGTLIDDLAADRLAAMAVECVQISVDGATADTHARARPGSGFAAAIAAIERLVSHGLAPQWVFVPNRFNLHEIVPAFDLASRLGCSAFVTGPLMRIGRAHSNWNAIAASDEAWQTAVARLRERASARPDGCRLAIYPWDIVTEIERRAEHPQAMLLMVPNGTVKLLNALPFAVADLRRQSLEDAWRAYRDGWCADEVRAFVARCRAEPALLRHANEIWPVGPLAHATRPA